MLVPEIVCIFLIAHLLEVSSASMKAAVQDRRMAPRAVLSLPVRIRTAQASFPEEVCTTLNVSRNGLYFLTTLQDYSPDMSVYVTRNFHPSDPVKIEEKGTVVRVEKLTGGMWGVIVRIPRGMYVVDSRSVKIPATFVPPAKPHAVASRHSLAAVVLTIVLASVVAIGILCYLFMREAGDSLIRVGGKIWGGSNL
jgi:hypothetical protein